MEDIPLKHPINALVSFHYFDQVDVGEIASWGLRLIGDSGAFSALSQGTHVDVSAFGDWAERWVDDLCWIASLDVIGDAKASHKNYNYLRDRGLDVVPTIHYGEKPETIDRYVQDGVDFIGLGGMVGRKSEPKRLLRWALSMFRYVRDKRPNVRFHGWGVTHPDLVMNLPWFSVDSSGFASAYRYGRLPLFDPSSGKRLSIDLNGKDVWKYARLLRDKYGVDPARVAVSTSDTRRDLVRLSVSGAQQMENYLRKRHNVVPPTYGLRDDYGQAPSIHYADTSRSNRSDAGTRVHAVSTSAKDYRPLNREKS